MKKLVVIYWSGTGNTERMAKAIAEGGAKEGVEVKLLEVDNASKEDVISADYVALGCPSSGAENLEEDSMEPFVESLEDVDFSGKRVALFGSYDWGDGEWMRNWEDQMRGFGAELLADGLIVNLEPEDNHLAECKELGQDLVQ